jgi:hypothetical protein
MLRSRRTSHAFGLAVVAVTLAGCARHTEANASGGGSGLGMGPMPSLTPVAEASGLPPCTLPPRVPTPGWVPPDLPWPDGSYVTRDLGGTDTHRAEVIVPMSQPDFARFIQERWPNAGYAMGESDAEPGKELEQGFSKGGAEGGIKAEVVRCDPGYQSVFLSVRSL